MSTTAEFVDPERLEEALHAIRDDSDPTNWVLVSHVEESPNHVDVQAMGSGGFEEVQSLLEDNQVHYVLGRIEEEIDMSVTTKFVYIHWIGQGMNFAVRGRFGVVAGSVQHAFQVSAPYHVSLDVSSPDEMTVYAIMDQIAQASGTKSKVLDEVVESRQGHARPADDGKPKMMPQVSQQGAEVSFSDESIGDILEDMRNKDSQVNCIALHFPENNIKKGLELLHRGDNGLQGLAEHISDESSLFALIRVTDVVDDIPTIKFIQITWIGDRVKPMAKAKIATQKGDISRLLGMAHVSVHASHRSEVTERAIMDRVSSASGSRKV